MLDRALRELAVELGLKAGQLFGILRVATTGKAVAPPLFGSLTGAGPRALWRALRRCGREAARPVRELTGWKMDDFLKVTGHGVLRAARRPSRHPRRYKEYLRATGQPLSPALKRPEPPASPISTSRKTMRVAYCRWASGARGHAYRLPTMAELQELYVRTSSDGINLELWPHTPGHAGTARGHETGLPVRVDRGNRGSAAAHRAAPAHVLGSIFYPPWLRHGNNAVACPGAPVGHGRLFVRDLPAGV